jgi:tRNA-dihydrouridine synthase
MERNSDQSTIDLTQGSGKNFWKQSGKLLALAPMEDVTDTVFREVILRISGPGMLSVLFTEFTSTDGLCHPVGKSKVSHRLEVSQGERELLKKSGVRLVVQIWGSDPEKFYKVSRMLCDEYSFDGIDINMGCPVKKIVKQATCSQLIAFPDLAREIVQATREGSSVPVSVKTRTGIKEHSTETWIPNLLSCKPDALILHGRTQRMMSDYPAEWNEIAKAVKLRNEMSPDTVLIGNGDLFTMNDVHEKISLSNADGGMIGRGIFRDPWIFHPEKYNPGVQERLDTLLLHTRLFCDKWGKEKNFNILKRFFKIYINGFHGAAELRAGLMETHNLDEVYNLIELFRQWYSNIPIERLFLDPDTK